MSDPLRVLQVFVPGPAGGLENVVAMLAPGLMTAGVEVAVTAVVFDATDREPSSVEVLRAAGVRVFGQPSNPRAYLQELKNHSARIAAWRPDIVHSHGYRADILASLACGKRAARVSTLHGFTGGGWKNLLYEALHRQALRGFDSVVAVAPQIRNRLVRSGVQASRISVIPNGWAARGNLLSRDAARQDLGIPAGELVIGWVGRLSQEKGADVLIAALPQLTDLAFKVSMIGEGPLLESLKRQADGLGVSERIRWHGLVRDAGRLQVAFDCFVLSSRTEGTPIALFEAMAAGIPCVATRVGGVPAVLRSTDGLLVDPEDPAALGAAVRAALTDRAAASVRAMAARERVGREYALAPWIQRHIDLYHATISRRGKLA